MTTESKARNDRIQAAEQIYRSRIRRKNHTQASAGTDSAEHPLVEAICQSAVYSFTDSVQADNWFATGQPLYARDRLPNVRTLERMVADLEGAEDAIAVASGMAAIATTVLSLVQSGQHVLINEDAYCESTALLRTMADRFGIRITSVNLNDSEAVEAAVTPETRLVLAETISNPGMRLLDIPKLASITRHRDVILAVDNTFATPIFCQPLNFGADLVIHSAGKFLGGHSDVTAGIVAGSQRLIAELKQTAHLYGPVLAPMEAWLTTRGVKTLLPRMTWASASATQVAAWLADQPGIHEVRYAGLESHKQVDLVRSILPDGAGAILTFRLCAGQDAAIAFVHHLQTIPYVPSVGGITTIISFPPQLRYGDYPDTEPATLPGCGMLRLSVGLEDPQEIIDDLRHALDMVMTEYPDNATRRI